MFDPVIHILGLCQDDERTHDAVFAEVCELVRTAADASVTAIVDDRGELLGRAGRGVGPVPSIVLQVLERGVTLGPASRDHGVELGVPVELGGRVLGAIGVRWPLEPPSPGDVAGQVATMAAAAIAARVRAASESREVQTPDAVDELGLVGVSGAIGRVRAAVRQAASAPFTVLVEGESGSGKELVARAIHRTGPRRQRRFCAVNCAAFSDELLEAELFGHARGAFTGALAERPGLFEEADGGTLFLDEVAELSSRAQAKLLRALQEHEIRRVGENFSRRVDVRVIAATNRPLREEARAGRFREDLRYRLDVIRIELPPLRARPEDVPELATRIWQDATSRTGSRATLPAGVMAVLTRHDWPGNVRELQNVLAALAVAAPPRGRVAPALLEGLLPGPRTPSATTLDDARRRFEIAFVQSALARSSGRRSEAARALGVSRQGLRKLLLRLGLADPTASSASREAGRPVRDRAS